MFCFNVLIEEEKIIFNSLEKPMYFIMFVYIATHVLFKCILLGIPILCIFFILVNLILRRILYIFAKWIIIIRTIV